MANLVVTVSESVTINGALRGSSNSLTVTDITDTFERVITCPHTATTTIATFSSNVYDSAGALDKENVRYIRVSNLSATHDIEIGVAGTASNYSMLIPAGNSHLIARADDVMLAEADAVPTYGSLADIAKLEVRPTATTDVDVEIFVASI
ncbi:MAG: hypothetical protein Tp172MES593141_13 [Prokaryotic dsDNA virus sp.]|jgi:hypothetical protein|nr:MAG: hypothetical protein Tp172MES593141_13 [Prokaryotic dsDNA virus sp.]|tara:strand:+ start:2514 stop:2963 length:450 start_codon:yes stop_codon:yes gene_type:complete